MLDIPKSVFLYFDDQADQSALLTVGKAETFPKALSWHDLGTYVQARQITHQVQHDYWLVLKQAWDQTWGESLRAHFPDAAQKDIQDYYEDAPSVDFVWTHRLLLNYVTLPSVCSAPDRLSSCLCTAVRLKDDGRLTLSFGLDDGHDDWLAGTRLSLPTDHWSSPFSNWERRSQIFLNIRPKIGLPKLDAFGEPMTVALNTVKALRGTAC